MYQKKFSSRGPRSHFGSSSRTRSHSGTARRFGRRSPNSQHIDPALFINKAVITEEIDHFKPEHQFGDFAFEQHLKQAIADKGYLSPTPIQDRAIPFILKGANLVGIANTGTGKTAAFLLPLINKVLGNRQEQVLIIVPTRELVVQIDSELKEFTKNLKIFSVSCYGGTPIGVQLRGLRHFNNFIIGTPGRLKDLINRKAINLTTFKTIVLDEADRMLDMGFLADMRSVMALMPTGRQTLFFSATLSSEIEKLIGEFMAESVRISVKTQTTSKNIDQDVVRITPGKNKIDVLHDLLTKPEFSKVLIFGRTKHGVEKLSKILAERGIKTESIHGNKNQSRRQKALGLFKNNSLQALIATDVAARGLDIDNVSHVINFDLPATYDDYVHRIGRTGRANRQGKALTFLE